MIMNSLVKNILSFALFFSVFNVITFAQSDVSTINKGVDKYDKQKYTDAEVDFRKVVEGSPNNFEANFNLGDSYYKQKKYEDAIKSYDNALKNTTSDNSKAKVYHNIGNALLKSNKIQESVDAYKNALKLNPNDDDTKYNLSYALELLKNKDKKQKQKNDQNKNDQNKNDKNNQKNQNQNQQNKDQNKKDQKQNQQPQNQEAKQDNTKQQQQPKENKISKQEAQRILDALKNNEKDLQKKLRKKTGEARPTDKDW
jgi:Ca-activated chloride channel family protein